MSNHTLESNLLPTMTKPARALSTESGPRSPVAALRNLNRSTLINGKLHAPGVYPRLDYREQFKVAVGTI
jgi:hypothetical protein